MHNFYRAFEERFRGTRELVKKRLGIYLPFVSPLLTHYPDAKSLDLGCGRGEWLEILSEVGFDARGVDIDSGMLNSCYELGLSVERKDALQKLSETADASLAVISAFHVVEHISFDNVLRLLEEAFRVLVPGGILILETPNPENIVVATCGFHLDPTHQKPIPPQLLNYVVEYVGFEKTKIVRLQESEQLLNDDFNFDLISVLEGVSPDYAVIGQKSLLKELTPTNEDIFHRNFGLDLKFLANKYSNKIESNFNNLEIKIKELEIELKKTDEKAQNANEYLKVLYTSTSWRITAPLRWTSNQIRLLRENGLVSRVKSLIKKILRQIITFVNSRSRLKRMISIILTRIRLDKLLRPLYVRLINDHNLSNRLFSSKHEFKHLNPHAQEIYNQLKITMKKNEGHN